MKLIPLTQGQFAKVDDDMYDELMKFQWCSHWNPISRYFYAERAGRKCEGDEYGLIIAMHRVIMNAKKGNLVDHIDHDTLNNQRSNLRICTASQNQWNTGPKVNNKSGYKGVSWHKGANKWIAQIRAEGKYKYLGIFTCKHEAARAHNEASLKYHGEYAYTNEIKEK